MAPRKLLTILALTATVATPALAQEGSRRRPNREGNEAQQGARAPEQAERRERAVPRTVEPRRRPEISPTSPKIETCGLGTTRPSEVTILTLPVTIPNNKDPVALCSKTTSPAG